MTVVLHYLFEHLGHILSVLSNTTHQGDFDGRAVSAGNIDFAACSFLLFTFFLFLRRIIQILFLKIYLLIRLIDCLNHRAIGKYLTWLLGKFLWKHLEWSLLEQNSLLNISLIYSQIILSSDGILLPYKRLLKSLSLIISLYQMSSFKALCTEDLTISLGQFAIISPSWILSWLS